jgi:hypothetical protein
MRLTCLPAAALTVVALSALLVSGCTSSPSSLPLGPLGPPGNSSTQCTPGSLGHADTVGLIDATNSSGNTLTINAIDLAQQQGIKLVGAYVTRGAGAAGVWATFPPPADQVSAYLDWSKRIPSGRCPRAVRRDDQHHPRDRADDHDGLKHL